MPTLAKFGSCSVTMYVADHPPPHFHIVDNDGVDVLVDIRTLTALRGKFNARSMGAAKDWAEQNRKLLANRWKELNP